MIQYTVYQSNPLIDTRTIEIQAGVGAATLQLQQSCLAQPHQALLLVGLLHRRRPPFGYALSSPRA